MNQSGKSLLLLTLLVLLISSCKKDKTESNVQGQAEFSVSLSQLKSTLTDTIASNLTYVVVSIEDNKGNVVKNSEKIELYNMQGNYISKPLGLVEGNYTLTRFLVLDRNNKVVYASPVAGSAKAYLVSNPLTISFTVNSNAVVKVTPEVLKTVDSTPEDFGYATFGFDVAESFDFLLGVFVYDNTAQNFGLTQAQLKVTSNATVVYQGALNAYYNGGAAHDTLAITNKVTLPERYSTYTIQVSKVGYNTYSKTFSKEDLRKYFLSVDNAPLVVVLEESGLYKGLVAYYKFDNNARDTSGMGNHGNIIGSTFKFDQGPNWYFTSFNSYDNYITIPNSASLNMRDAITVGAWVNSDYYVGGGFDPIVAKPYYSHTEPFYQYQLGMSGDYWKGNKYTFGFAVSLNGVRYGVNSSPIKWIPGNWYFVVGTYNGNLLKIFVNGVEISSYSVIGQIDDFGQNLWIGHGNNNGNSNLGYTPAGIDEVRIYNRALTQEEIVALYNDKRK
ncbi:MAG TPA: LamG domain-containing protein [Bacteroidales bacterium]|nr:LamG domain-containing protein [Bacteroidales bacterium]